MSSIIRRTRRLAVEALASTIQVVLQGDAPPSEPDFRDAWLRELRRAQALLPDGWYTPPPHGLTVLIAQPPAYEILRSPSIRGQETWPSRDRRWDPECIVYAYASPVDATTGLFGDLAVVLYAGSNEKVARHVQDCRRLALDIAERAAIGMPFAALYADAVNHMQQRGYANHIVSATDPAGTNIGHTVPHTETGRTPRDVLGDVEADKLSAGISAARVFVSPVETRPIEPGVVLTIEPRMSAPGLPTVGFHFLVAFHEGGSSEVIDELQPAEDAYRLAAAARSGLVSPTVSGEANARS